MNVLDKPPADRGPFGHGPEEIDGMLREFFQREIPARWPAAPVLPSSNAPSRGRFRRSRLALAASVAFLLGGNVWLSGMFDTADPGKPEVNPERLGASGQPLYKPQHRFTTSPSPDDQSGRSRHSLPATR